MISASLFSAPQHRIPQLSLSWRHPSILAILIGLFALVPSAVCAQEPDSLTQTEQLYRVETSDGTVVIGTLSSGTETEVVLDTEQMGTVTLKRSTIERMEKIRPDRLRDGTYWFPNPQSTRYFFAPNAIGIPKGKGYYQNTWILFNNANYGVSDHVSIGAGTVPTFLFGASSVPVWLLPKVSFSTPQEHLHVAGGAMLGGVLGQDNGLGGLLYGSATVGGRDHNATLGLGYGYSGSSLSDTPAVNVSGMTRVGRTTYLLSENYLFPGTDFNGIISFGVRWAPENFAVDFGLFRPLEETGDFVAFPWLGVTIPFGS